MSGLGDVSGDYAFDAEGRLAQSVLCRGCGFDLRGALAEGSCPECGKPVMESLVGDLLRYADRAWLDRVRGGWKLLLIVILAAIPSYILVIVLAVIAALLAATNGVEELGAVLMAALIGLFVIALFATFGVAVWRLSTPEPGAAESRFAARRLARWGVLSTLLGGPIWTLLLVLFLALEAELLALFVAIPIGLACVVAYYAGFVGLFWHARRLILRVPAEGLARQTKWCMLLMLGVNLATWVVLIPLAILAETSVASSTAQAFGVAAQVFNCFTSLVFFGLFIWAIVLLFMLLGRLKGALHGTAAVAEPVRVGF